MPDYVSAFAVRIRNLLYSQRSNIKDLTWLVAVQFTAAVFGFLTQVKIANTLGKELFGQIAYGALIGSYCAIVIQFGMDRTLTRDIVHYPERTSELVRSSLILRYILAFFVIGLMILWKLFSPNTDITWGIFLIVVSNSLYSLDLKPLYDAWKMFQLHSVYFLTQKVLYLLGIWAIILFFPQKLSVFSIGLALFGTLLFYLVLQHQWAMNRIKSKNLNYSRLAKTAWWLVKQNWIVFLAASAGVVTTRLSQIVLKQTAGYAELGAYAAAWQIVTIANLFLEQIMRIGNTATARNTKPSTGYAQKIRFLLKYSLVMLAVAVPFSLPMVFCPKTILSLFFKPEYFTAVTIMPILGVYLLIYSVGMVASQYVINARMEKGYLLSVSVGAAVSVLACHYLIPTYGIVGAAWALLLSHGSTITLNSAQTARNVMSGMKMKYSKSIQR